MYILKNASLNPIARISDIFLLQRMLIKSKSFEKF